MARTQFMGRVLGRTCPYRRRHRAMSAEIRRQRNVFGEMDTLRRSALHDVVFVVGDEEIPANRNVLAARSPVFRTMFLGSFREGVHGGGNGGENVVRITDPGGGAVGDIGAEAVRVFVTLFYDKVDALNALADALVGVDVLALCEYYMVADQFGEDIDARVSTLLFDHHDGDGDDDDATDATVCRVLRAMGERRVRLPGLIADARLMIRAEWDEANNDPTTKRDDVHPLERRTLFNRWLSPYPEIRTEVFS